MGASTEWAHARRYWETSQAVSSAEVERSAAVIANQEVLGVMSLKKTKERPPCRTCDGRRKCCNRNRPAHGLGKGEALEHTLVVGPREASVT